MISPPDLAFRNKVLDVVRGFFRDHAYLEADTPVRLPALIPERWIEPEPSGDAFLQTSPEICMKRLMACGHERLFQICHCFRKKERGRLHLPEFTMLEWYRVDADYLDLMDETEALVRRVLAQSRAEASAAALSLDAWPRLTVAEAFDRYAGINVAEAVARDEFDRVLVERIEPALAGMGAVFLCDYPPELASLAKVRDDDPSVAERFELYIGGVELVNGFSELTDVDEQRRRFADEIEAAGGDMPERFLEDLAMLGRTAGAALGFDRLVMLAMGADSIDRAVAFAPEEL